MHRDAEFPPYPCVATCISTQHGEAAVQRPRLAEAADWGGEGAHDALAGRGSARVRQRRFERHGEPGHRQLRRAGLSSWLAEDESSQAAIRPRRALVSAPRIPVAAQWACRVDGLLLGDC